MALDSADAEKLVSDLWPDWYENRTKSLEWQNWAMGRQELPVIPDTAKSEYLALQKKAVTPWLALIVQSLAQALIVEGYRRTGGDEDNQLWSVWQANNMDAKQVGLYEAAMTTGISYLAVLPADSPQNRSVPSVEGVAMPEWRPYASSIMTGFFDSPYDESPVYALAAERVPTWRQQSRSEDPKWRVTLFDDQAVYLFEQTDRNTPVLLETRPHDMGEIPVVAYVNRQTITGRAIGEVEPYTAVASRIDQDVLDRLVVQRFASWRVRYATGLVTPDSDEEQAAQELSLKVSDILVSDSPDTSFGSLPETPLDGHLRAPIEDVRMLAAVSQTPPTHLSGDLANISAEALAAIEAAYNRKVEQRKVTFGEAHEKCFALSARLLGIEADDSAQVRWRDMESRSLGQLADAFGKVAQMLEVPVQVLWDKLPFLTDQDRTEAKRLREEGSGLDALVRELANGQTSPPLPGPQQEQAPAGAVV